MTALITLLIRLLMELSSMKEKHGEKFSLIYYFKRRWMRWAIHVLACVGIMWVSPDLSLWMEDHGYFKLSGLYTIFIPGIAGFFGFDLLKFGFGIVKKKFGTDL